MKELKPVSGEDLIVLFKRTDFRRLLREAAVYTNRTGYETAFAFYRDLERDIHSSNLALGCSNRASGSIIIPEFKSLYDERIYPLLDVHFHPDNVKYVIPSGYRVGTDPGDLVWFNKLRERRNVNCKPICAVGRISKGRGGELLLLQENTTIPISDYFLREVGETLDELAEEDIHIETKDIVKTLSDTKLYKCTNLRYKLVKDDVLIRDEELQKVKIFAYTPTLKELE